MRLNITFIAILVSISQTLFSQQDYGYAKLCFDTTYGKADKGIELIVDTLNSENVWTIADPDGKIFNKSYHDIEDQEDGGRYALITDKSKLNSDSVVSTFYLKYVFPDTFSIWGLAGWNFWFVYQSDLNLREKINVEISFDNEKWHKFSYFDPHYWQFVDYTIPDFPKKYDTFPAFLKTHNWVNARLEIFDFIYVNGIYPDSCLQIKFSFLSDYNSSTEGVLLDEFTIGYQYWTDLKVNSGLPIAIVHSNVKNTYILKGNYQNYSIIIYNLNGKIIYTKDKLSEPKLNLNYLKKGVYILAFSNKFANENRTMKIIIY